MSPSFPHGLVVGKFCPLHRGHEALIDFAANACERLSIVSYSRPEFAGYPPALRQQWLGARWPRARILVLDPERLATLARLHGAPRAPAVPDNDAADEVQRQFMAWVCRKLLPAPVQAVFTSETYGEGFAQSLSRAMQSEVEHVSFDPARRQLPISGTAIRADPLGHRAWLSPSVYAHFVQRIALLGGESSGKTTLARALARRHGTAWVPEYGRERWVRRRGQLADAELLRIAQVQIAREQRAAERADRWLFCDTTPLTTLFYCLHQTGDAPAALRALAGRDYAQVWLCAPDFAHVQDGTRQDASFRQRHHDWLLTELQQRGIPHRLLQGSVQQRLELAERWLDRAR